MLRQPYAAAVCRIEPENNVHLILEAFARQTKLRLAVAGNWKNSAYGLSLFQKYSNFSHIHLLAPVYDGAKINALRSRAALYIHGHQAGGTNPSLVEAMFLGLPVLAFDCIYNRYTTENCCLYWSNQDELFEYISNIDTYQLDSIGKTMRAIARARYRWETIIKKYETLYA